MTPEEYIEGLRQLFREVRDSDALDFAARFEPTVHPPLTAEQIDFVAGTLEGCAMAVAMLDAKAAEVRGSPDGALPRGGLPLDGTEDGVPMTPAEYIERIEEVLAEGTVSDASAFADHFRQAVRPPLTPEQIESVAGYLEGAAWVDAVLGAEAPPAEAPAVRRSEAPAPRG